MCLYPKLILNKKYLPTRKNNFNPPPLKDLRVKWVAVGCGVCIECRKQLAQSWRVRLNEELKIHKYAYFVTLTFATEELEKLQNELKLNECNALATKAVRRFLERYRKKYKKSVTHWLITELGHENTERIHLHGIIFSEQPFLNDELQELWKYGITDNGKYCNQQTINYIIKYVTKVDTTHKNYRPVILCSPGIGKVYINKGEKYNKYADTNTKEYYTLPNGRRVNLPIYYRNKIFTEEQREQLWCNRIDEHTRYVMGIRIDNVDTAEGDKIYQEIREQQRKLNTLCGYGDDSKEWQKQDYNVTQRMLNKAAAVYKNRYPLREPPTFSKS